MKSNYLPWVIGGAVVILGGYLLLSQPKPATEVMVDTPPAVTTRPVVVALATQNDLGQSGSAALTENADGKLVVELTLTGETFPDPQPAHIHSGACPMPGVVAYPLTNVVDGQSVTTLPLSWSELIASGAPLAINVHKSTAEASIYTACGDVPVDAATNY